MSSTRNRATDVASPGASENFLRSFSRFSSGVSLRARFRASWLDRRSASCSRAIASMAVGFAVASACMVLASPETLSLPPLGWIWPRICMRRRSSSRSCLRRRRAFFFSCLVSTSGRGAGSAGATAGAMAGGCSTRPRVRTLSDQPPGSGQARAGAEDEEEGPSAEPPSPAAPFEALLCACRWPGGNRATSQGSIEGIASCRRGGFGRAASEAATAADKPSASAAAARSAAAALPGPATDALSLPPAAPAASAADDGASCSGAGRSAEPVPRRRANSAARASRRALISSATAAMEPSSTKWSALAARRSRALPAPAADTASLGSRSSLETSASGAEASQCARYGLALAAFSRARRCSSLASCSFDRGLLERW
mmetsp:Transcript_9332/g.36441  ORF Transcript_9332/g.36441 Transcript_9332/m.36441 type:complete len:372 (-) Transcript_9332:455-1570(-)